MGNLCFNNLALDVLDRHHNITEGSVSNALDGKSALNENGGD